MQLLANATDKNIFKNMLNKEHDTLDTNAFDGLFGIGCELERVNNNDQTFDFIKTISVLRSNPLNKLTIVLHKVESRFQYCPDWKQKFNSNKIRIFVINRKHVSTSKQNGYLRNFLI